MSAASITTAWCRRKWHELLDEVQEKIEFDPVLHERFCSSLIAGSARGGAWRPRGVCEARARGARPARRVSRGDAWRT